MNNLNSLIYYELLTGAIIRSVSTVETLREEYLEEEIPEGQGRLFVTDVESIIGKKVVDGEIVDDPAPNILARIDNRNYLLSETDWYSIRHRDQVDAEQPTSLTADQYAELLVYRQALRDWPVSGDYGEAYPVKPGWLS